MYKKCPPFVRRSCMPDICKSLIMREVYFVYIKMTPCKIMIYKVSFAEVRGKRFELSHPFGRYHLKVVRLPISPPTQPGKPFFGGIAKIGFSVRFPACYVYFLRTILKVVPFPGSDSNPICPPILSTALRTIVKPMPVPSYSFCGRIRSKRRKIRWLSWGEMPMPWSSTQMRTNWEEE